MRTNALSGEDRGCRGGGRSGCPLGDSDQLGHPLPGKEQQLVWPISSDKCSWVSYHLQEAMQLQGLAEEGSPPGDLGGEVVTEVLELLTLGVDGVHGVVFVLNQLLSFQRQGSGPVHSHLHNASRYQFSPMWRDKWGA